MKKLITLLALVASVTIVSAVRADNNPVSVVTNAVEQAKQAVVQAQSALASIQSLAGQTATVVSTNAKASNTNTVASTNKVATTNAVLGTINDAVIDILRGVKTVGSDVYQASKSAITKSIDFTMEQAPLVVHEFIYWKVAESSIYALAWAIPAVILLCIARSFRKQSESADVPKEDKYKTDQNDYSVLKWGFRAAALILLTINLTTNGLVITKLLVAPRVYLIEYVVDTIHANQAKK